MTYYKLSCPHGYLKSGSSNLADIEAHRKSLIHENEMKVDIVRRDMAFDLSYLVGPRHRAASISWARRRIALLKSEIKHWRNAPVEMREI